MEELASALGRERLELEYLLFKILELKHLLRAGDNRFLRWAAEEVRLAGEQLQVTESARGQRVSSLGQEVGITGEQVTLATLAERTPEPWRTIFTDHNDGFRRLADEVDEVMQATRTLADASGHSVADVLQQAYRPNFAMPLPEQRKPAPLPTMLP